VVVARFIPAHSTTLLATVTPVCTFLPHTPFELRAYFYGFKRFWYAFMLT
jgi:hypothetical protein